MGDFEEDYKSGIFFKIGRSTGITTGEYHGIKSLLRTEMPSNHLEEKPPPRITNEHVIISNKDEPFSEDGDSGAWVLNRHGDLVGMIWGAANDREQKYCYFTPIAVLKKDIEEQTGMEVELVQL